MKFSSFYSGGEANSYLDKEPTNHSDKSENKVWLEEDGSTHVVFENSCIWICSLIGEIIKKLNLLSQITVLLRGHISSKLYLIRKT